MKKFMYVACSAFCLVLLSNCTQHRVAYSDNSDIYIFSNNADIQKVLDCNVEWNDCIVNTLDKTLKIDSVEFKKLLSNKTCDYEYIRCLSTENSYIINTLDDFDNLPQN